ncbi:hypothetical protein VTK56DRAFT_8862 [Thermocarpiscus australiensis]
MIRWLLMERKVAQRSLNKIASRIWSIFIRPSRALLSCSPALRFHQYLSNPISQGFFSCRESTSANLTDQQPSSRPNLRQALELAGSHFVNLVEIGILKAFIDFAVFDKLPEPDDASSSSITVAELAARMPNCDEATLERMANFLVATGILASPSPGRVAHHALVAGLLHRPGARGLHRARVQLFAAARGLLEHLLRAPGRPSCSACRQPPQPAGAGDRPPRQGPVRDPGRGAKAGQAVQCRHAGLGQDLFPRRRVRLWLDARPAWSRRRPCHRRRRRLERRRARRHPARQRVRAACAVRRPGPPAGP